MSPGGPQVVPRPLGLWKVWRRLEKVRSFSGDIGLSKASSGPTKGLSRTAPWLHERARLSFSRRPRRPGSELTRRIDRSAKLGHRTTRPSMPSSHHHLGSSSWTSRSLCFPDSRDLEVLGGLPRQGERPQGGPPRIREDPLATPPSLSAKKVLREPRGGPENLGSRRSWRSKIMNPSNNDYWVALERPLIGSRFPDFFSRNVPDFLGRLRPRRTRLRKPRADLRLG